MRFASVGGRLGIHMIPRPPIICIGVPMPEDGIGMGGGVAISPNVVSLYFRPTAVNPSAPAAGLCLSGEWFQFTRLTVP